MFHLPSPAAVVRFLKVRGVWIGIGVFLVAFVIRAIHLDRRSIWMDEDRQAAIAAGGINPRLFVRAAAQQQPPIDYAAERITLFVFGWNEYGARMHAAVWGALAAALFFLLLRRLVLHPAATMLGTAAFVVHPLLIRYSQEGRPISCGVFFSVVWLLAAMRVFRTPLPAGGKRRAVHLWPFFAATLLFLLSVGFQPVVFLATAGLAVAGCALVFPRIRNRAAWMLLASVAAFAVAAPVLLLVMKRGGAYMSDVSFTEKVMAIARSAFDRSLSEPLHRYQILLGSFRYVVLLFVLLGAVAAVVQARRRWLPLQVRTVLLFSVLFAVLYPFVLSGLYYGLVTRHGLEVRYYLTALPLFLLLFSVCFSRFWTGVGQLLRVSTGRARRGALSVLLVAAVIGTLLPAALALPGGYEKSTRTNWRSFYSLLKKDRSAFGTAYLMNLVPPDKWAPVRFYATRFYYRSKDKHPIALKKIDSMISDLYFGALSPGAEVYWAVPYGRDALKPKMFKKFSGSFHRYKKLSVVHVTLGERPAEEILSVFNRLVKKAVRSEAQYKLVEIQAELRLYLDDREGAKRSLRRLRKLDKRGVLAQKVISPLERALAATAP